MMILKKKKEQQHVDEEENTNNNNDKRNNKNRTSCVGRKLQAEVQAIITVIEELKVPREQYKRTQIKTVFIETLKL